MNDTNDRDTMIETDGALPTIAQTASRLAGGVITVMDEIAFTQARIARFNSAWRAFSHLCDDTHEQAQALQGALAAGRIRSPLHGLTVSVKGNIPVAGMPWTEGSAMFGGRVATRDAGIVTRVRAAGGVILGTTTLSELAMYGVTNPFEPMGLNPWDASRTAGGSSTGAGVAASLGLAHVNIGTDSGGSIRNPACHCGVVGFMPRIGGLTLEGKPNHTPSLSSVGLIGRSVDDVEAAWNALAEAPGRPADLTRLTRLRLLVPRQLVDTMCDGPTLELFGRACERLVAAGFELVDAEVEGWMAGEHAAGIVSLAESGSALARMDLAHASDGIRARAANAARLNPNEVQAARAACAALRRALPAALQAADAMAVLTPTWPFAAPAIDALSVPFRSATVPIDPHRNCFVRAGNAVDGCAITLPMGIYPETQVPAGLHLTAPGGDERRLLALARLAESCLPSMPVPPALAGAEARG